MNYIYIYTHIYIYNMYIYIYKGDAGAEARGPHEARRRGLMIALTSLIMIMIVI